MFEDTDLPPSPLRCPDALAKIAPDQIETLRGQGIEIGFDPALQAWVRLDRAHDRTRPMLSGRPTVEGLRLRPWRPDDSARYAELLNDAEVWRYLYEPFPDPMTEPLAQDLITIASAPHHIVRAVTRDGEAIGQVRLLHSDCAREAELSYWLGRAYWGKGLARPMVRAALDLGFLGLSGLTRITAFVHPANTASQHVLTGCGFAPFGPRADGWLGYARRRG